MQLFQQGSLSPWLAFHPIGAHVLFPVACHPTAIFPKLETGICLLPGKVAVVLEVRGLVSQLGPAHVSVVTPPACYRNF